MTIAIISHPDCLLHDSGSLHPEKPDRLRVIDREIRHSGLDIKEYLAPEATVEQLLRVHERSYVDFIYHHSPASGLVGLDADTWMNPFSLRAALRAAGAGILAVDLIMKNDMNTIFCNIR